MDWGGHPNITKPEDFWALWNADQDAFAAIGLAQGASRSGVAALTLLAWDVVTTMDEEVKLIWFSGWSLPKALYLFVRYYSLFTLIFHNIRGVIPCVPWLIFEIMSIFVVEAAAEVIIILRIYAVYAAQQRILRIMLLGLGIQLVIMIVSLGVSLPRVMAGFYCQAADLPVEMVLYSTASIIYETFLFALMMVGVIRSTKDGFGNTTLVRVLVRDGMFAFVGLFLAMLLNTLLFTMAPTPLVTLGFPWLLAIIGIAGSRLVLNLRAKHSNNLSGPSSLADLRFNLPSHMYSELNLDDELVRLPAPCSRVRSRSRSRYGAESRYREEEPEEEEEEEEEDHEEAALNPGSRSNTMSSGRTHDRDLDDVDSQSELPPSPLSPETVLPR